MVSHPVRDVAGAASHNMILRTQPFAQPKVGMPQLMLTHHYVHLRWTSQASEITEK
jgi:hypothetical protein